MEDRDLVRRLADGDDRVIDELVEKYKNPLYGFILRMVNDPEDAEDLFQETWIRVVRNRDRFRGDAKFSTWLFQIAVNLVRDLRRKGKGWTMVPIEDHENSLTCDPDVDPERLINAQRIKTILSELPEKMREVMVLKYYHDLSEGEIAQIAGCPEGTVKSRVFRASKLLKTKWEKRYA